MMRAFSHLDSHTLVVRCFNKSNFSNLPSLRFCRCGLKIMLANEKRRSTGADDEIIVLYFINNARIWGKPVLISVRSFSSLDSGDPK